MLRTPVVALALLPLFACASSPGLRTAQTSSFDGLPLVYDVAGAGDSTLVFVHGWCCNRSLWSNQVPVFAADHRVVALDLGGGGDSGRDRADWSLDVLAADVVAILEALDLERVILVGHSMGGPVSVLAAARAPDRVVGVVGLDCLHNVSAEWPLETLEEWVAMMEEDFPAFMAGFVEQMFLHDPDSPLRGEVEGVMASADPAIAIPLMRAMFAADLREAFRRCPVPIRCINAADGYPTDVEGNRAFAPGFEAATLGGVGHFLHLENPTELNALLADAVAAILGQ